MWGPFGSKKGARVWPLQDTVALARGLKRIRVRSSSKGQAEARSLTHWAKLDISQRSVIWVRVFPGSAAFHVVVLCSEKVSKHLLE